MRVFILWGFISLFPRGKLSRGWCEAASHRSSHVKHGFFQRPKRGKNQFPIVANTGGQKFLVPAAVRAHHGKPWALFCATLQMRIPFSPTHASLSWMIMGLCAI